ncbi:hypothetical protein A6V39_03785 [Candidatus Mycoplasma haematobovis]|uniref:Uncharacterized protein n=1 Tax=Candidatus Mycoplasma haematobovis TaxID=432608 RepID=A0A1A9QCP6_9MOLU|nr:hypothetical protein [Candidatus Mycoplasma haematobovis]OAL10008.1 hypothetical protein A6V39_03785 [Candidatus Mycoplasma haematobovis]
MSLKSAGIGAGLITGAAGLTGTVGYATGLFNSNTQITELLKKQNKYALLSAEANKDAEGWDEAWKKYKKDNETNENGKDKWTVKGWTKQDVPQVPDGFKNACSKRKDNKVSGIEDSEYTDFTKYCARPKTVQEILEQENFKPLTGANKETQWKTKLTTYKVASNQLPNAKINSDAGQERFNELKSGCEAALKIKTTDDKYDEILSATRAWCGE